MCMTDGGVVVVGVIHVLGFFKLYGTDRLDLHRGAQIIKTIETGAYVVAWSGAGELQVRGTGDTA